jgi:purine-binding chemotaxis protein CheW
MKRFEKRAGPLDWEKVHQRLAQAAAALGEAEQSSTARDREILEARARALARVPARTAAGTILEVVTFALLGEHYALEAGYVCEVQRWTEYTPVPGAVAHLHGLVNLRGELLAVFDLAPLLGLAGHRPNEGSYILVLGRGHPELGILVDAIHQVQKLPLTALHAPAAGGKDQHHVRGLTDEALIILDGRTLLADERLFIDQAE